MLNRNTTNKNASTIQFFKNFLKLGCMEFNVKYLSNFKNVIRLNYI